MDTLEQLSGTLASLDDLRSIVRTMKALAAASLRQYDQAALSLDQYVRTVELGLHVVLQEMPEPPAPHLDPHGPMGVVVFGSDNGLCGRFNEDVRDFLRQHAHGRDGGRDIRILAVGARIALLLEAASIPADEVLHVPGSAARITTLVDRILLSIDAWRRTHDVTAVHVFYNRRRGAGHVHTMAQRLLPVDFHRLRRFEEAPWPSPVLPTFRMDRDRLFAALLRQYLFAILFRAAAESQAAEHTSRLRAMQAAGRNLDERQADLTAEFRRRRQEVITAELLDIVSGFEALSQAPGA